MAPGGYFARRGLVVSGRQGWTWRLIRLSEEGATRFALGRLGLQPDQENWVYETLEAGYRRPRRRVLCRGLKIIP